MWQTLCRHIIYPVWDLKDGGGRLREYRSLLRSQWWDSQRLRQLQLARLRSMVDYAYAHCSYYRDLWGAPPRLATLEDVRNLPLIGKGEINRHFEGLLSTQFANDQLVEAKTGGSTGVALRVMFDKHCQKARNAAAMRSDCWSGWNPGMWVGALWGSPPVPKTLKEKIRNGLHDRICYLDTMNLSSDSMHRFGEQMRLQRTQALFGHAHSLFIFAGFLRDAGIEPPAMQSIVATSMMLLENERQAIEQVFRCRVSNRYGCEEVGLIASECERHQGMHINAEHVLVEFIRANGSWAAPGEEGRIVVTDLMNHGMPLVRYLIEDLGVSADRKCPCGRGLPLMERLTGRTADFLLRRDGGRVAGVSLVEKTLTAIPGIEQLQIVQNSLDELILNVVPSSDSVVDFVVPLRKAMQDAFGSDVHVEVRPVDRLTQERNSKYRFSICHIDELG